MSELDPRRYILRAPSGDGLHGIPTPISIITEDGSDLLSRIAASGGSGAAAAGHTLVALGDSIAYASDAPAESKFYDSYSLYTQLLTGGKVRFIRNAGVGGNKSADMLARFDTDVTPYAPTMVSVLAGTNDFTFGVTDATFRANIKAIVAKIRAIGAVPLLYTSPPVSGLGDADKQRIYRNNAWMAAYAAQQGIVCVDAFAVWVDPASNGNWQAALTRDGGTHPNEAGHAALGQATANALNPLLAPLPAATSAFAADPLNLITNGLFLTDSSGWGQNWGPDSGTITPAVATDSAVPGGHVLRFTLASALGRYQLRQFVTTGFSAGDVLQLTAIASTTATVKASIAIWWTGPGGNPTQAWVRPVSHGLLSLDGLVVPSGTTSIEVTILAGSYDGSTPATGTCDFGAITLRNKTANGSTPT
jgi:lysophospholipase L1-like esterase